MEISFLWRPSFFLSSKMKLFLSSTKDFRMSRLINIIPELISSWQTDILWSQIKLWSISFSNNVTFTNLRYSCSQMQSHDLNSKSMNSSEENSTESDSLCSVSCLIVPRMMFNRILGFCLHQLKSQITWDLFFRSIYPRKLLLYWHSCF